MTVRHKNVKVTCLALKHLLGNYMVLTHSDKANNGLDHKQCTFLQLMHYHTILTIIGPALMH